MGYINLNRRVERVEEQTSFLVRLVEKMKRTMTSMSRKLGCHPNDVEILRPARSISTLGSVSRARTRSGSRQTIGVDTIERAFLLFLLIGAF